MEKHNNNFNGKNNSILLLWNKNWVHPIEKLFDFYKIEKKKL